MSELMGPSELSACYSSTHPLVKHGQARSKDLHPGRVAGLTCSLSTEREQVFDSLENTQKSTKKNAKLSNSNISDILLFKTRIYDISKSKILFSAVLQ